MLIPIDKVCGESARGDNFSLPAFHDFLWKNGNLPIALQRWEYLGEDDDLRAIDKQRP